MPGLQNSWGGANATNNTVYLNFDNTGDTERYFDFLFPVPTLENPELSFIMYGPNDLVLWTASAKNSVSIDRGEILVFEDPVELSEAKVATNVLKKNDFYLEGYNIDGQGHDEEDVTTYHFNGNGTLLLMR